MNLIRCLHIMNANEAIQQMKKVGVDSTGVKLMAGKTLHFNLSTRGTSYIAPVKREKEKFYLS